MPGSIEGMAGDLRRRAGKGLAAGAIYLSGQIKSVLSVPAPRRRVLSRAGVVYYVATEKALPGAPPRKLSGALRRSITWAWIAKDLKVRVGTNIVYGGALERMGHEYILPTLQRERPALRRILGKNWSV